MYCIGLTGGIASGKSTVSKMLAEFGAYIIDADKIAHMVMQPKLPAFEEVVALFGQDILMSEGTIDRKKLGALIFENPEAKKKLDTATHPYIREKMHEEQKNAQKNGASLVVWDVPLLIEAGWYKDVDEVWVVYVDAHTQLTRLRMRNGFTVEEAKERIESQMLLDEKVKYADVVIDNTNDLSHTRQQILSAWKDLQKKIMKI